jgi:probable rRNA maturation factor
VNLSLNRSDDANLPWLDEDVVESIRKAGASLNPEAATVNIVVVDDPYIREINRDFRDIDKVTDVISFSYIDDAAPAPAGGEDIAGEVYISHQTIEKEAKALGVDPGSLFLRVGVHGLLHVVGFDHAGDEDAARMEREEKAILSRFLASDELDAMI